MSDLHIFFLQIKELLAAHWSRGQMVLGWRPPLKCNLINGRRIPLKDISIHENLWRGVTMKWCRVFIENRIRIFANHLIFYPDAMTMMRLIQPANPMCGKPNWASQQLISKWRKRLISYMTHDAERASVEFRNRAPYTTVKYRYQSNSWVTAVKITWNIYRWVSARKT